MSDPALTACLLGSGSRAGADQRGASAVEYAILVGFIAAVIVGAVGLFGLTVSDLLDVDLIP